MIPAAINWHYWLLTHYSNNANFYDPFTVPETSGARKWLFWLNKSTNQRWCLIASKDDNVLFLFWSCNSYKIISTALIHQLTNMILLTLIISMAFHILGSAGGRRYFCAQSVFSQFWIKEWDQPHFLLRVIWSNQTRMAIRKLIKISEFLNVKYSLNVFLNSDCCPLI